MKLLALLLMTSLSAVAQTRDRQVIYPSICFTAEGMLVVYSNHMADPDGSFANQYSHESPDCGAVRCILEYPEKC